MDRHRRDDTGSRLGGVLRAVESNQVQDNEGHKGRFSYTYPDADRPEKLGPYGAAKGPNSPGFRQPHPLEGINTTR